MGQTLTNGIYLPNEGERNCYSGLAANWNAVDTLKGNYSLHAINVDIHVTAAEKETWNSKADNSALTAHTGDTTIHVTSADKQAWDGHVADTTIHVTSADKQAWDGHVADTTIHVTAEDKAKWDAVTSKADDSDVVHKSGNETISGVKTFSDNISTKKIISNVAQLQINARSSADSVAVIAGANATEGGGIWLYGTKSGNNALVAIQVYDTTNSTYHAVRLNVDGSLTPTVSNNGLGSQSFKWATINGINPGALSLPDFSNAIDISSYITVTGGSTISNSYTPPTDGYISVNLGRSSGAIGLIISNGKIEACVRENTFPDNHRECGGFIPVQKNDTVVIISCLADSIIWAYFIPCQGNI